MPPVVFLHGWGGSFTATFARAGWLEAAATAGREVVGIDLPGHGGGGSTDPADYADLTGAVAAHLPDGPLDLVGFSLGGKIALALSAMSPGRIRRIVVGGVGDNLFAPEPAADVLAGALVGETEAALPGIAALIAYARSGGGEPRALAAVLRRPANPVLTPADLRSIGPILLVNGTADAVARPDDRLRAALGQPVYRALDGVDHLGLPAASGFRDAALAFLCAASVRQEIAA